jgi:putative ABC transport system permease protein
MLALDILEQSLIFLPFALGVFLSYNILKIPDLTVEGSFVLGASIFSKSLVSGFGIAASTAFAVGAGFLSGLTASLIQFRNRIPPLIAGILMLFILNSLNLIIMGKPNISLLGHPTAISLIEQITSLENYQFYRISFFLLTALAIFIILFFLLASQVGLLLRAFGNNMTLLRLFGKNSERYRILGLGISNAFVAFSGTLTSQINGYSDITMGLGIALIGIGTVIIGNQIQLFFSHQVKLFVQMLFCFCGVLIYFTAINFSLSLGLPPIYLKMLIGISLVFVLFFQPQQTMVREVR